MDLYLPVLALTAVAAAFAVFSIAMSAVVGPKRYNRTKIESYECGINPAPRAADGGRIELRYYTVAMTFIIFDVEIMFLVPWAIYADQMGQFGFWAMMLFIFNLCVAYAYEWRRGGLDWD